MKIKLALLSIILPIVANGQYYNFSMGVSWSQQQRQTYTYDMDNLAPMIGFNAQFGYDWRIWEFVFFSAGLGYDQTGIVYSAPEYNESFGYLQGSLAIKLRTTYAPVYFGVGGYGGLLMSASKYQNNEISALPRSNYLFYDYGISPVLGIAAEFDFFMYFAELKYKMSFPDIYLPADNQIKNRNLSLSIGVAFIVR